ncbi:hypothetical protein [Streptomyces sp. AS02]|uniref:hypothetical protein n=1 Tax=Streptomyces sp. AS02 TaxID=2938946 RepID=UPI002021AE5D|nr:hypothetical protein [Streptomyces sp. AS02]MCL8010974.1 hypothetical protein [Streptomyces sp. AS02]
MFVTGLAFMTSTEAAEVKERASRNPAAQSEEEAAVVAQARRGESFSEQVDEVFAFGVRAILDGLEARLGARSDSV